MLIRFASVSSSILFTILIDALIVSGSFCTVVGETLGSRLIHIFEDDSYINMT